MNVELDVDTAGAGRRVEEAYVFRLWGHIGDCYMVLSKVVYVVARVY